MPLHHNMTFYNVFLFALLVFASSQTFASDPSQLQDFCVADNTSQVIVNGLVCKNPNVVTPEDFFFQGLDKAGDTANKLGSNVNRVNVDKIPGLNTLGVSIARIDIAPYGGLNTLHFHPRASEIATVIEGTVYVGFVTSDPNKLFAKVLNKGDVYVFPQGLIHFEFNIGPVPAVVLSGFSSQNPGVVTIADAVFGSNPYISDDVLAKAFQLDKKTIDWLKTQFPISSAY